MLFPAKWLVVSMYGIYWKMKMLNFRIKYK